MAVNQAFIPLRFQSFEGGLNVRDAPTELALNESPSLMNVVVDERGGITKRTGNVKWNASPAGNLFTYPYYSRVADLLFHYSQADGKMYSDPGTGVLTLRRTWTTGSQITIVDFAGKVYATHPVDGLYSSPDGVTWTAVTATSGSVPKGDLAAVWQNKLWIAGDVTSATTKTRLYFSAAGDATKWAVADGAGFNDVREGRDADAPIVALFGATGADFQAHPTLLVFKRTSSHRVYDASTGAYQTIDAGTGAAGQLAVATDFGRIYVVNVTGIYQTDGQSPLIPISGKLDPLFSVGKVNYTLQAGFCMGVQDKKITVSIASASASANDIRFDYNPAFEAFTQRTDAARAFVSYPKSSDTLLAYSPTVVGQVYQTNTGGADDGVDITSRFTARVIEPLGGLKCRMQMAQFRLAGTMSAQILPDYSSAGTSYPLAGSTGTGFVWDVSGAWTTGTLPWGDGGSPEGFAVVRPRLVGKSFQFRIDETSSLTRTKNIQDGSTQITVGAWSLYGIDAALSQLQIV